MLKAVAVVLLLLVCGVHPNQHCGRDISFQKGIWQQPNRDVWRSIRGFSDFSLICLAKESDSSAEYIELKKCFRDRRRTRL